MKGVAIQHIMMTEFPGIKSSFCTATMEDGSSLTVHENDVDAVMKGEYEPSKPKKVKAAKGKKKARKESKDEADSPQREDVEPGGSTD